MRRLLLPLLALLSAHAATAQELPDGQSEADFVRWLGTNPGYRGQILSFESWQEMAGVKNVLPTWQLVRTASMWRECNGAAVRGAARSSSGPTWSAPCASSATMSAPRSARSRRFRATATRRSTAARAAPSAAPISISSRSTWSPGQPLTRRQLFERLCPMHSRSGPAANAGLGFYTFMRFHIDTKSFRRYGSAGPQGNESPCAVLERGEDPEAPPLPPPVIATIPPVPPPVASQPQPDVPPPQ